ncbi:hypothetical protein PUN28_007392 [Cardiocondyla obscurior]|uniref:Uncharacterized protein n=1 Tax=Cardiocondyla obscurior TaxID=286306 RepID=A0AAW2G6P5_9HYME
MNRLRTDSKIVRMSLVRILQDSFNKEKETRDRCKAHRDAAVKAQALRQEKEKRHRNIWAHRCTIVERAAQLRALATGKKAKEKQNEVEEDQEEGEKTGVEEKGSGIRVASRRRGRRKGTEAYLPPTYMLSRGFWWILGVPGTRVETQSWVRGSKRGRRTKDADAHRPVDPPCAGP